MVKRVFINVAIGLGLAIAGQFVQLAASLIAPLLGIPTPYESAPDDGSLPDALLEQIGDVVIGDRGNQQWGFRQLHSNSFVTSVWDTPRGPAPRAFYSPQPISMRWEL